LTSSVNSFPRDARSASSPGTGRSRRSNSVNNPRRAMLARYDYVRGLPIERGWSRDYRAVRPDTTTIRTYVYIYMSIYIYICLFIFFFIPLCVRICIFIRYGSRVFLVIWRRNALNNVKKKRQRKGTRSLNARGYSFPSPPGREGRSN
jgi:hypothetical protein